MRELAYDIYVNNCKIQRTHYFGYMQMLVQRYRNSGDIVKVEEVYIGN